MSIFQGNNGHLSCEPRALSLHWVSLCAFGLSRAVGEQKGWLNVNQESFAGVFSSQAIAAGAGVIVHEKHRGKCSVSPRTIVYPLNPHPLLCSVSSGPFLERWEGSPSGEESIGLRLVSSKRRLCMQIPCLPGLHVNSAHFGLRGFGHCGDSALCAQPCLGE